MTAWLTRYKLHTLCQLFSKQMHMLQLLCLLFHVFKWDICPSSFEKQILATSIPHSPLYKLPLSLKTLQPVFLFWVHWPLPSTSHVQSPTLNSAITWPFVPFLFPLWCCHWLSFQYQLLHCLISGSSWWHGELSSVPASPSLPDTVLNFRDTWHFREICNPPCYLFYISWHHPIVPPSLLL